jgi:hypothetical protein
MEGNRNTMIESTTAPEVASPGPHDADLRVTALALAGEVHRELMRGNPQMRRDAAQIVGDLIGDADRMFTWLRHGRKPDAVTDAEKGN